MSGPIAYLNGNYVPQAELHLPLHDAGFVFGATITDLCRTFRHQLFRLQDHLARFRRGCSAGRVPQPLGDQELTSIGEHLTAHNSALLPPEQDLALVLIATPGPIDYYASQASGPLDLPPTLALHTFPLPFARYERLFREGAHLVVPQTRHVPAQCTDPRIKQRSRLSWWLAEQEARQLEPGAMALALDLEEHVTETAAANFLLVRDGVVYTPPRETVLGGISLQVTQELCNELGIRFVEQPLGLDDCLNADEAMLSSTPYCLAGVSRINGSPLPWPGLTFAKLLAGWDRRVGLDIRRQICLGF